MSEKPIFPDLKDASVFITGGGSGIGAALTEGYLQQGAKVAFIDLQDASAFVAEMETKYGRAPLFFQGDITDTDRLQGAIDEAALAQGPIQVLVNNAANDERRDWRDITPEFWDQMLAINLKAYFFAMQAVAPAMEDMGGGAIVNFSSISYMMGNGAYAHYTAANAGITGMTRTLARDMGPKNIRINAIAPGWVLTERQIELWGDPVALAKHLDRQCLKEHMAAEDLVGTVLFLSSNASRMMTGQCVAVDGGVVTVSA